VYPYLPNPNQPLGMYPQGMGPQPSSDPRLQYGVSGVDPSQVSTDILNNVNLGGVTNPAAAQQFANQAVEEVKAKQGLGQQLTGVADKAKTKAGEVVGAVRSKLQEPGIRRNAMIGAGIAGTIPGILAAGSELSEGRPLGAAAAGAAGAVTSGLGTALLAAPHPLAKLAGGALMLGSAVIPGIAASGAESIRQKATGEPTKGKEAEYSTQMAMREQMLGQDLSALERTLGVNTSAVKDLSTFYSDQAFRDLQRNAPLINQLKNADLIRQQALINTQGQQYAMLGTLGTAGKLATGGQEQTGATVRTALTSNPYNVALQAPAISFG
jgi:hypothetical protein